MAWGPETDGLIWKLLPNHVKPEPMMRKTHKRAQWERKELPAEKGPYGGVRLPRFESQLCLRISACDLLVSPLQPASCPTGLRERWAEQDAGESHEDG